VEVSRDHNRGKKIAPSTVRKKKENLAKITLVSKLEKLN